MYAFDWLKINNKCDFRLANRFAQWEFFKFFITKDDQVRTNKLPRFPSFSLPNHWINTKEKTLTISPCIAVAELT